LGSAPIFLSLTADHTPEERTRLARDVAINSFFMMLGSLLFGSEIIEFFGIEIPVIRVAGGLIIAWMGWKLLKASSHLNGNPCTKRNSPPASRVASTR
jgi:multiple antibiotic resistance protein